MKVFRLSVLPLRTVLVALTLSALALPPFVGAADFSLNPARDFGAIRRIDPRDYSGLAVVREDGSGLSSSTAAAFRAALEVFSKAEVNASDALNVRLDGSRAMTGTLKFSGNYGILQSTSDGADNGLTYLAGGGAIDNSRGGTIVAYGNEYAATGGQLYYRAGNVSTGDHVFLTADGDERLRIAYNGTSLFGTRIKIDPTASTCVITGNTASGSDNLRFYITSAGAAVATRGPIIGLHANNFSSFPGAMTFYAGGVPTTGIFRWFCGADADEAMRLTYGGNLLIGTTTDDGSHKLQVNGRAYFSSNTILPNNVGYACKNRSGTARSIAYMDSSDVAHLGTTTGATRIDSNGTLTHNGSTVWTAASDGAGSGLDADTVPNATPASAAAAGTAGSIRYDANYIYICVAANTWKRAAISTW